MSKTLVICCDGTGNSETGVASNVKRLWDCLLDDGTSQLTTYHRGVGTDPRPDGESRRSYWAKHLEELAFGDGIDQPLAELYCWLAAEYCPDDRLFLFGFSRGAFTVRALAGMLHVFGPCEIDHAAMDPAAREFAARRTPCAVDFLGLWDTVKAYGWVIPKSFPALRHNTSVRTVRHAVALDEVTPVAVPDDRMGERPPRRAGSMVRR